MGGSVKGTYTYDGLERLSVRAVTNTTPSGTTHLIYDTAGHLLAEANGANGATIREYVWLEVQSCGAAVAISAVRDKSYRDRKRDGLKSESHEQGFVLLTVLLFLALISAISVQIMTDSLSISREAAARSASTRHTLVLDAALNRAIHALENPDDRFLRALRSSSAGVSWQFDGTEIRVDLVAESGKLDLNTTDLQLLRVVSEHLFDDDPAVAESIVSRISTWRQQGRRFEFVEAVLSAADRLRYPVEIVRQVFTVLTGQIGFDPETASELLLKALPGQSAESLAELLVARRSGHLDAATLSPQIQSLVARERPVYTVGAELASPEVYARREVVVLIEANSQIARVLSWRRIVKTLPRRQ